MSLPPPFIFTPGVKNGLAGSESLATVLKQIGAKPKYSKSFPISSTPKIISAEISYRKGNNITPLPNLVNGKIIDKEIENLISRLRRGDKIEIIMKAKGADKITHKIFQRITIR